MENIDIVRKIKHILNDRFGLDATVLDESSRLRDIGIDSLHVVEIMLDLEADLGVKLNDLSVPPNPSLGEVAAAISRNLVPQS
jgi:acyl carrier protein